MNKVIKFGDEFSWKSHDEYVDEATDSKSEIAVVVNDIMSDEDEMKQHNFKDHGMVNGLWLYSFTTDEHTFICQYIYDDEHQAYLFRHRNEDIQR